MADPILKKRKIAFAENISSENKKKIEEHIKKQEGVSVVDIDRVKREVNIEYDLRRINFERIEKALKDLRIPLSNRLMEKWKRSMAKYTEQNELDNLAAKPESCCKDPKDSQCH